MQTCRQQITCSEYTSKLKLQRVLIGWVAAWIFILLRTSILWLPENHSQNVDISEQSIGRQEPLNCQCEGLLVSNKSEFFFLHIHCFIFENHFALLNPKLLFNVSTQTCSRKRNKVLDVIHLWALVVRFVCLPQWPYHLSRFVFLTAGRDSTCDDSISHLSVCWLKYIHGIN